MELRLGVLGDKGLRLRVARVDDGERATDPEVVALYGVEGDDDVLGPVGAWFPAV